MPLRLPTAFLALGLPLSVLHASPALDTWLFADAAGQTLHQAANTAPGRNTASARWDVAVPDSAATGVETFRIRNNGLFGPGRRTTFVDFAAERSAGRVVLTLSLDRWNLAAASATTAPRLELDFVQGEQRLVAGLVLALDPAANTLRYGWRRDGGEPRWQSFPLPPASTTPADFRLGIDLDTTRLAASLQRPGQPERLIGISPLAPGVDRLTSLRFALSGDFTAGGHSARHLDLAALRFDIDENPHPPGLAPGPDGQPGILIAALGLDQPADVQSPFARPHLEVGPLGDYAFNFFRARDDFDYLVERSADLVDWQVIAVNPGLPGEEVSLPVAPPVAPETRVFTRLRLQVAAP